MNIKQKILTFAFLIGIASFMLPAPVAMADPATSKVECGNGKSYEAKKSAAEPVDILDDKDYEIACKGHGGYKTPDTTVSCGDKTVQGVFKDSAKPKDKVTKADKEIACEGHKGIAPVATGTSDNSSGGDGDLVDGCSQTTVIKVDCSSGENAIWGILLVIVNVLSAGVILVAIGGFVFAAILYSSAADNSGQVSKAKGIITNIVIGLVCYALMWSFLQFLIPGGVFK